MTVECVRRGSHVLVEKPMALTLEQCDQMITAAETAGVCLMVSQNQRFMAQHRKAKEILDAGLVGEVYLVHSVFGHGGPENWSPTHQWYFTPSMAGLGVCADLGIHKIDLVRWITGQEVAWISAFSHTFEKPTSLEDTVVMSIQLSGGTLATIQVTWAFHPGWQNSLVMQGERGAIYVPTDVSEPVRLLSDKEALYPCPTDDPAGVFGSLKAFVRAIQNGEQVPVPGQEGRASMAAILAASQSAAERTVERPA
jgi:predicted dehydrogenase